MIEQPERGTVKSVERTLELFELLVNAEHDLGLRELSEASGLPVGTVHRLLSVLLSKGYVRQNWPTRRYTVGFTAMELAARIRSRRGLLGLQAQPFLRELAGLTGECANLAALDGTQVVYLEQVQSPRMMRMSTGVGDRLPLHATGIGKVLLAHLPQEQCEVLLAELELTSYTPATVTDRERLRRELERVREQGYARAEGELEEGLHCVAVPVRDASGQVIAALSVSGPATRLGSERINALLPQIKRLGGECSHAVGYERLTDGIESAPATSRQVARRRPGRTARSA